MPSAHVCSVFTPRTHTSIESDGVFCDLWLECDDCGQTWSEDELNQRKAEREALEC